MSPINEETRRKLREINFGEFMDAMDIRSKDIDYSTLPFEDRMKLAIDYVYAKKQQQSSTAHKIRQA